MNNFTLVPYSTYIFAASLAAVAIFGFLLARSVFRLSDNVESQEMKLSDLQNKVDCLEKKSGILAEENEKKRKKNRLTKLLIPAIIAVKTTYDIHENYHGVKGYGKAAKDVFMGSSVERFRNSLHQKG